MKIFKIIAFFSVKISDKPADYKHPYGHGKVENISGIIEALLILAASIWITKLCYLDPIVAILVAKFILNDIKKSLTHSEIMIHLEASER